MGRMYTISATSTGSVVLDIWDAAPAVDKPCILHAIFLSNIGGTSDAGDAQEELLEVALIRGAASNSGGTTTTPVAVKGNASTAAGFVARMFSTITTATGGTVVHREGWNVRVPYIFMPTPEMRHDWSSAGGLREVMRLMQAPNDTLSLSVTVYLEEV